MLVVSPDRFLRQKCSDTPSPCVSPDPQGSCAVPFVSADRAAVAAKQRCRDGQEPALVRRIGASIAPAGLEALCQALFGRAKVSCFSRRRWREKLMCKTPDAAAFFSMRISGPIVHINQLLQPSVGADYDV